MEAEVEVTGPDELTPEQIADLNKAKKLSDEAKSWRLKYRQAEKTIAELQGVADGSGLAGLIAENKRLRELVDFNKMWLEVTLGKKDS